MQGYPTKKRRPEIKKRALRRFTASTRSYGNALCVKDINTLQIYKKTNMITI